MVKLRSRKRSVLNLVGAGILISLIVAGIFSIGLTAYAWSQDLPIPQFLVNAGPFLLVLVTLINIGLSGLGFLEARKERRLTRESLIETRKQGMVETVVRTTEDLTQELQDDQARLEYATEQPVPYPVLPDFEDPSEELLSDISSYYPNIVQTFGNIKIFAQNTIRAVKKSKNN